MPRTYSQTPHVQDRTSMFNVPGFIQVTDCQDGDPVLINVAHINTVTLPKKRYGSADWPFRAHIGINNTGALGYDVVETPDEVADLIRQARTTA